MDDSESRWADRFDVLEYPAVNPVNDRIGRESPGGGGPDVVLIPGRDLEQCTAAGDFREWKLTATTSRS